MLRNNNDSATVQKKNNHHHHHHNNNDALQQLQQQQQQQQQQEQTSSASPSTSSSSSSSLWKNRTYFLFTLCFFIIASLLLTVTHQQQIIIASLSSSSSSSSSSSTAKISKSKVVTTKSHNKDNAAASSSSSSSTTASNVGEEDKQPQSSPNKKRKKNPIKQISLIGERNSGTKWTWAHLEDCFNHSIPVSKFFTRYKHWFQHNDTTRYPNDTLIIAQFRNPYDWVRAMQRIPHHSPAHLFLDWEEFVTKPWTMARMGSDLDPSKTNTTQCQFRFQYKDVISCAVKPVPVSSYDHKLHYSEEKPLYEMRNDGSGTPYANILEMRTDKIRNFLTLRDMPNVRALSIVQYEYLLRMGTASLLQKISTLTGIAPQCTPYEPQIRRARNTSADFLHYITEHIDWDVEGQIGYAPRT